MENRLVEVVVVEFRMLGPLEVAVGGRPVAIRGRHHPRLLALLLDEANRVVPVDRLIEGLWEDGPPDTATQQVQNVVSGLRRQLGAAFERVETVGRGYRVTVADDELDVLRCKSKQRLAEDLLRAGRHAAASAAMGEAIAEWRGPALAGLSGRLVESTARRLDQYRLTLLEQQIRIDIELGRHEVAIARLRPLTVEYPLHQRFAGQLMLALHRSGRSGEAFGVYAELRAALADELGVDPDAELRDLHTVILKGDGDPGASRPRPAIASKPAVITGMGGIGKTSPASLRPGAQVSLTRFVGRETETKAVARLLRDTRLVTLVGAPGAGKTRLAAEVAAVAARSFREGLRSVALAPVSGPEDVVTELAVAFGVRDDGDSHLENSLVDALRTAEVLILLDNCEHVAHRVAELTNRILAEAPRVRMLTTSRVPLGILGERLYRVPQLSRPEAAELFCDRARMVTDLVLDETGREYVDQICRRLDRLPLAIELAARQTRALSLRDLLVRLDTELLRVEIPRSIGPAHRTMAATIAWSCRLLSAGQRRLFERLSVFAGDFDFRAVEAVAWSDPQLLTDLTVLVDHSLLLADPAESGAMRYRMLEPIRQYAASLLDERGDTDTVRARHAAHYLETAREAARGLMRVDGHRWFDELRRAEGNLLAAVNWARELCSDLALQLVTCMAGYWDQRGYINEARERVEALIDRGPSTPRARAEALLALCQFGYRQGRYAEARPHADEAIGIMSGLGDDDGVARGLRALGLIAGAAGDTALAIESSERSVAIFQALGDRHAQAWSHIVLAFAHFSADDVDRGEEADIAALRLLEISAEAPVLSYRTHIGLSYVAYRRRDAAGHRRHLEASIAALRRIGALDGDVEWMWSALSLAHDEGRMSAVLRLTGAARALVRQGSTPPRTVDRIWRRAVAAAEDRVGPRTAEQLLAAGATMTIEEAVAEATGTPARAMPLSARELEVARLTGQGLTNTEIAERLFISRRTVETHQEHIREKLHLTSRYEVMAWALAEESV